MDLTKRFQALKDKQAESVELKAQVRARIEVMKPQIDKGREDLAAVGITYDSVEELESILADKEARFSQVLSNLEDRYN